MLWDLPYLKAQVPLLDYLQRHNWSARRVGSSQEFFGLCPLHQESRPSFYVNAGKNLFYCHGCGQGGDVIRFVQLLFGIPFSESIAHLRRELGLPELGEEEVFEDAADFYQAQLSRYVEAIDYLYGRGIREAKILCMMRIGYAPGGVLRRHLTHLGYSSQLLLRCGLINTRGQDAFYGRIVFPCFDPPGPKNLYGRSLASQAPHRFLGRSKGGLLAWRMVSPLDSVILVEGAFDVAILWQEGFCNATCAFGTHLTQTQIAQLSDRPGRAVFIAFDSDHNRAGESAARALGRRLREAGLEVRIVSLPAGQDPNSFFLSGATADDFRGCLEQAEVI